MNTTGAGGFKGQSAAFNPARIKDLTVTRTQGRPLELTKPSQQTLHRCAGAPERAPAAGVQHGAVSVRARAAGAGADAAALAAGGALWLF